MERDGVSHGVQQRVLESMFGTKGAHFRTGGKRFGSGGQKRKGTGRNAGDLGERDRSKVSEEVNVGKQTSLRDNEYMAAVNPDFVSSAMEVVDELESPDGGKLFSLRSMTEDYDTYRAMLIKAGTPVEEINSCSTLSTRP